MILRRPKVIIGLWACVLLVGCSNVDLPRVSPTPTQMPVQDSRAGERVTLIGRGICMPHRDTSGPQTLECALGFETADEVFGVSLPPEQMVEFETDGEFQIIGTLKPADSDKYVNDYVIEVESLEKIGS